jgi:hypothetical protein
MKAPPYDTGGLLKLEKEKGTGYFSNNNCGEMWE